MNSILTKIFTMILEAINLGFEAFSGALTREFALKGDQTLSLFFKTFPAAETALNLFHNIAWVVIMFIFIWKLAQALAPAGLIESESPISLVGHSIAAAFAVKFSGNLAKLFFNIGTAPYNMMMKLRESTVTEGFTLENIDLGGSLVSWATGGVLDLVINVVFTYILFQNYIKLVFEIAERYVIYGFLTTVSPLIAATVASKSTSKIFGSWISVMISQTILMIASVFFLEVFHNGMSVLANSENFFIAYLLLISWLKTGQNVDNHMNNLGFKALRAGGLGLDILQGMDKGGKIAAQGVNAMNKQLGRGETNYKTAGQAIVGAGKSAYASLDPTGKSQATIASRKSAGGTFTTGPANVMNLARKGLGKEAQFGAGDLSNIAKEGGTFDGPTVNAMIGGAFGEQAGLGLEKAKITDGKISGIVSGDNGEGITTVGLSQEMPKDGAFREIKDQDGNSWFLTASGANAEDILNDTRWDSTSEGLGAALVGGADAVEVSDLAQPDSLTGFEVNADSEGNLGMTADGGYAVLPDSVSSGMVDDETPRFNEFGTEDENGGFILGADGSSLIAVGEDGTVETFSAQASDNGGFIATADGQFMKSDGTVNSDGMIGVSTIDSQGNERTVLRQASGFIGSTSATEGDAVLSSSGEKVELGSDSFTSTGTIARYENDGEGGYKLSASTSAPFIKGADGQMHDVSRTMASDGTLAVQPVGNVVRTADGSGRITKDGINYAFPVSNERYEKDTKGNYVASSTGGYVKTDTGYSKVHESAVTREPGINGIRMQKAHGLGGSIGLTDDIQKVQKTFTSSDKVTPGAYAKLSSGDYRRLTPDSFNGSQPQFYKKDNSGNFVKASPKEGGKYLDFNGNKLEVKDPTSFKAYQPKYAVNGIPTNAKGQVEFNGGLKFTKDPSTGYLTAKTGGREFQFISEHTNDYKALVDSGAAYATTRFNNGVNYIVMERGSQDLNNLSSRYGSNVPIMDGNVNNRKSINMPAGLQPIQRDIGVRQEVQFDIAKTTQPTNMVYHKVDDKYRPVSKSEYANLRNDYMSGKLNGSLIYGKNNHDEVIKYAPNAGNNAAKPHVSSKSSYETYASIDTSRSKEGLTIYERPFDAKIGATPVTMVLEKGKYNVEGKENRDYKVTHDAYGKQYYVIEGTKNNDNTIEIPERVKLNVPNLFTKKIKNKK